MTEQALQPGAVRRAECVIGSERFEADLEFFTQVLGFRLDCIFPADSPANAALSGFGMCLRLERRVPHAGERHDGATHLRVAVDPQSGAVHPLQPPASLTSPGGATIELVDANADLYIPPNVPHLSITRAADQERWITGRASMQYRDLIPDRWGGRFIASHIRIPNGGPVPDYVHYHKIRFQMIFCRRGWVKVVYEDQGEPFLLQTGDCVLQPPEIRHRVLECSDRLEVIEIGCPAEHQTWVDHELSLPTGETLPDRNFGGQRFVRHHADQADWTAWPVAAAATGFECQDLGMRSATQGLASACTVRGTEHAKPTRVSLHHEGEFLFLFVLRGQLDFVSGGEQTRLGPDNSVAVPPALACEIEPQSAAFEFLEIRLPGS